MKRAVFLCALAAGIAHAETRPRFTGTVEGSLLGAPASLDPINATTHADATVVHLLYDTLYCVEADGIAQPHVALAQPSTDKSGKTARIAIRSGIRFHDGGEVTARDVVASIERAQKGPGKWALAAIASVRAEGDLVEFSLRAPVPDLAALLSLPQTAITKGGKAPGEHPNGSGPFQLESFDVKGNRLALKAFEPYFAGRPYLDHLVLRWYDTSDGEARRFETGDAQLSERRQTAFATAQPVYRADDVDSPAAVLLYVAFGRAGAHASITTDKAFRKVLDLAIARGALATITSGERVVPTHLPVPVEAGAPGLSTAGKAEDLAGARTALDDAAKRVGDLAPNKLPSLMLEVLVEKTRPDDRELGARVVDALDALGVHARVTEVSAKDLRDRLASGKYDLAIDQLAEPVTNGGAWWGAAFAAGGDDWAAQQLATGHVDTSAAQKRFDDVLPIVPLVFRTVHVFHRTDIHGLGFDAMARITFADLFVFGEPQKSHKP